MSDRDKLVQRASRLLAMSKDIGSPAEAEIAERRLRLLMDKYDISTAEIKRFDGGHTPRRTRERRRKPSPSNSSPLYSVKIPRPVLLLRLAMTGGVVVCMALIVPNIAATLLSETHTREMPRINALSNSSNGIDTGSPRRVGSSSITTWVDRASVSEDDYIVLNVVGSNVSAQPSTAALWQDFKVLDTDFKVGANKSFTMKLMLQPRRTGTMVVPSISVEGVSSKIIVLDVFSQ